MDHIKVLTTPPEPPFPPVFRLLARNGVFEFRTTPLGLFVVALDPGAPPLSEGYHPATRRCPTGLLRRIVAIFKERPDTEALISIVVDTVTDGFHLVWQGDETTAHSVDYDPIPPSDRFVLYAEIHSHHTMPAFFSATDDASEKATGLYGVVGRVDRDPPQALFRYACGGVFRHLPAEALFEPDEDLGEIVQAPAPHLQTLVRTYS